MIRVEEVDGVVKTIDVANNDTLNDYLSLVQSKDPSASSYKCEPLVLRKYQEELCKDALNGNNVIVCAPTGSGKTIVAVKIIQEHLSTRLQRGEKAKAVLLVPTVNLIDQQASLLNNYLANRFSICSIKGGQTSLSKVPKNLLLRENHISVMTPQLFLNLLSMIDCEAVSPSADDISAKFRLTKIDITDVSLIIFDECHHTDKSHAYSGIMNVYFDQKYSGRGGNLPQIVGLTASLGVGQANSQLETVNHILKLCANLDTQKLTTIEQYTDELEKYVYSPKDEIIPVQCSHFAHPLSANVIVIMKNLESLMEPIFKHLEDTKVKTSKEVDKTAPNKRWSSQYTSWLFGWYHYAPLLSDSVMKRNLITLLRHSIIYHKSLEINALTSTQLAVDFMNEEFAELKRKETSTLDSQLLKLFESQREKFNLIAKENHQNPIINRLRTLLLKQYEEVPDTRTLIFVRTRQLALAVQKFVNNDDSLYFLQAGILTGVNARKSTGGQTEREQQECLEKFRTGEHKLLIATTVAEEGLDISKCNLIVKYNHVTNEIALVQRRGRGRAANSRSVLLTHEGWIEQKETVNLIRERLMKTAVEVIKTKSQNWFLDEVDKRAKQMRQDREIEKSLLEKSRKKLGNKVYDLLCRKCDNFITSSTSMRVVACHFTSVDNNIWSRLCAEPKSEPMLYVDLCVAGNLSCCKCRHDCGVVLKYRQVYFPALKADALVVRSLDAKEKNLAKKWKGIQERFFVVDPIRNEDVKSMFDAMRQLDREKLDRTLERAMLKMALDEEAKAKRETLFVENNDQALYFIEGDFDTENVAEVLYNSLVDVN